MMVAQRIFLKHVFAIAAACGVLLSIAACSGIEKAKPRPESVRSDGKLTIDTPEILRGTVASETVVLGYDEVGSRGYSPIVVSGYGLVVGLNGTGSRDIPPPLRAYMLAEAAKGGFGMEKHRDVANISPEQLLDSEDTAVVVVEAIIPQGAVEGKRFDVRVYAERSTSTVSLEGGTLYTTELRPGSLSAGGAQAFALAEAHGPVFVNPFAEPGAVSTDAINRRSGRILNGGLVKKSMPLKLRLANPSHARAAILVTAINTRFPQEIGNYTGDPNHQKDPTARGESDELIEITVPPSWRDRTDEFIELLRHTSITQSNPEAIAVSVRRALLANPLVANAASLRWQALGIRVLPLIKDLYDYPEEEPRMAALRAGAKLEDALVVPHLVEMAKKGSFDARRQAIQLLGGMRLNPRIDLALRELLNEDDVEIRLEAYEALAKRHDPYMNRYDVDGKFVVDVVQSEKPMVYVTQLGQPRIVLFGPDLAIDQPATVSAWSNRFMLKGDSGDDKLEVYYRQPGAEQGVILRVESKLAGFIQFLGHQTTIEAPAPGLGLSYGETVGVLHQIWSQRHIQADFKAEQDRILAAINRLREEDDVAERPEFADSESEPREDPSAPISDLGRLSTDPPPGLRR